MCGLIGLLLCAFLAAAYMVPRTVGELQRDFQRRAIAASTALGVATTLAIPVAHWNASEFAGDLTRPGVIAAMAATATLGLATLVLLWRNAAKIVPIFAGATAAGVVVAWALTQNPHLIAPSLDIHQAAAAHATVSAFLIVLPIGAAILIPSLLLLYLTFSGDVFIEGADGEAGEPH
jgi:cytochrome d ubiquinol oxidase subunit II